MHSKQDRYVCHRASSYRHVLDGSLQHVDMACTSCIVHGCQSALFLAAQTAWSSSMWMLSSCCRELPQWCNIWVQHERGTKMMQVTSHIETVVLGTSITMLHGSMLCRPACWSTCRIQMRRYPCGKTEKHGSMTHIINLFSRPTAVCI